MAKTFGTYTVPDGISSDWITRYEIGFPNGYGASIIQGAYSYGGSEGLWELGVLRGKNLAYDTPITDDVLGYLSEAQVAELLAQIEALPTKGAK